jgi:hypothetical protein
MGKYVNPWENELPDSDLEVSEENLHLFFKTMFERQEIWFKRFVKKKERPWTKDKFLHNHKFTNVYRQLDRNSTYQIKNIYLNDFSGALDLLWRIMFFRYLNNPDFFEWLRNNEEKSFEGIIPKRSEYDKDEFYELMQGFRSVGGNPFTNAYLINSMACPSLTRDECYAFHVLQNMKSKIPELFLVMKKAKTPEEIISYLKTWPAIADFIAHEFYQDFCYSAIYTDIKLMKFTQDDFTNVGPGASLGIRLIFPSLKGKEQIKGIYDLRDISKDYLDSLGDFKYISWNGKDYDVVKDGNLTLHQIEMWLCEFQKYWKMVIGKGKQRSKFKPKTKV